MNKGQTATLTAFYKTNAPLCVRDLPTKTGYQEYYIRICMRYLEMELLVEKHSRVGKAQYWRITEKGIDVAKQVTGRDE